MSSDLSMKSPRLPSALIRWFSELTDQGIFATDRDLRIIVWNRWMEIHAGHASADVLGRPLLELYPELVSRGIDQYYRDALAGRISVISHGLHQHLLPLPPTNPDLACSEMPQTGRIGPLSDAGDVIGTVTAIEDISDRLASEAELRKQIEVQQMARVTAEKALRAKDEFLSTVSHEIRNPLNAVLGWTRILIDRRDVDPAMVSHALQVIDRNARAQARMIDDLLDAARIASGKIRLDIQHVDLIAVTLAAIDMVAPIAQAKQITIRTQLDPKTPTLLGDPQRVQQVVWNLLSNAVKFTGADGSIEVTVAHEGKLIRLIIRDTGHGIRPEFLPFVFDRFRQGDGSSTKRFGGLGLGLALVRELVELHGGTVHADSAGSGKGATFVVAFPIATPDIRMPPPAVAPTSAVTALFLNGVHILVVEDETDSRELLVEMLSQWGAEVHAVASSAEALSHLGAAIGLPDVLVSDLGMHSEDGYDLIRKVRALRPEQGGRLPAVAVTGFANAEDRKRALDAGYDWHVSKPVDPVTIGAAISRALRRPRPS